MRCEKNQKKVNCAVYGCGLSASGALAIPQLITPNNSSEKPVVTSKEAKKPKRISSLSPHEIRFVSSGLNNRFQVGGHVRNSETDKGQDYYISAKRVALPVENEKIIGVSSGRAHSLIASKTKVFAIGENIFGQCGIDPETSTHSAGSVHCSLDTSFVLTKAGEIFAFGLNEDGQCGNGKYGIQWQPRKVLGDVNGEKIIAITGSTDTLLALTASGDVILWGQNEFSQAGEAFSDIQLNVNITSVGATSTSCVVSNDDGEVYTWGVGVLGLGPNTQRINRPTKLDQPLFDSSKVVKVFAGNTAMAALNEKGRCFVWGENRFASLGLGHSKRPCQIIMSGVVRAAGLVVYRKLGEKTEFLLLQASYPPHHWTPPKGHVDPGEDEWTAALREVNEEAGLTKQQLTIHEDCHETLHYEVKGKPKSVKYWLALLKNPFDVKLSHEHQNWKWAELAEAVKIADYAEMGALLRKFAEYIQSKA
ncbi:unnamed protein product [Caenorhabditis auriculariae]|uniref:Bis(5'-nucleosyl)-tetraphosphatase [asymmetrical] n=1 Tax=Caenorhabditis auriculariae TaxID=2777116 RepID=A0A8S1H8Q8_9PELO|nr:unnamed protein product [Caenorhabditis auriculariae]